MNCLKLCNANFPDSILQNKSSIRWLTILSETTSFTKHPSKWFNFVQKISFGVCKLVYLKSQFFFLSEQLIHYLIRDSENRPAADFLRIVLYFLVIFCADYVSLIINQNMYSLDRVLDSKYTIFHLWFYEIVWDKNLKC